MRALDVGGLALLVTALAVACSEDEVGSQVSGAGGTNSSGGTNTSAGATNSGASSNAGSLLNLGGASESVGGADAGDGNEGMPDLPSEVNVIITADNAYGFGYGTISALQSYFGGVENPDADDIFDCPVGNGPEEYVVPAEDANLGGYLYIIGYADKAVTQGVIAKFLPRGSGPGLHRRGEVGSLRNGPRLRPG
jgi:hypothetical protein